MLSKLVIRLDKINVIYWFPTASGKGYQSQFGFCYHTGQTSNQPLLLRVVRTRNGGVHTLIGRGLAKSQY